MFRPQKFSDFLLTPICFVYVINHNIIVFPLPMSPYSDTF